VNDTIIGPRSCRNCEFRHDLMDYAKCLRVGSYCSIEMAHGHACGKELKLWRLRWPWYARFVRRVLWGG
jgi:hypothetical protein